MPFDAEILTKKYGPLPGWAWVGIVGAPVVYLVLRRPKSNASSAQSTPQPVPGGIPGPANGGGAGSGGGQPVDLAPLITLFGDFAENQQKLGETQAQATREVLQAGQLASLEAVKQIASGQTATLAAIQESQKGFATSLTDMVGRITATQTATQQQQSQEQQRQNAQMLDAIRQSNQSFSSTLTTLLGNITQQITNLANRPQITAPSAPPNTAPIYPYSPPYVQQPQNPAPLPPSVQPAPAPYIPPTLGGTLGSMAGGMLTRTSAPQITSVWQLPVGSYVPGPGPGGYVPTATGPGTYVDPSATNRVTVFGGNGQVWRGFVPS